LAAASSLLLVAVLVGHLQDGGVSAFSLPISSRQAAAVNPISATTTGYKPLSTATTRLSVSTSTSTSEAGTDTDGEFDMEALRGEDGIYNLEDKKEHK